MDKIIKAPLTMSSREIAELVGSRHDKVMQSIERLAERGVFRLPPMGKTEIINNLGLAQRVKEYRLAKRDSLVVVAQLCPEFTARIVDRWQELEEAAAKAPAFAIPQTLPEALRLAADLADECAGLAQKNAALEGRIEADAPKLAALTRIEASPDTLTMTQAAKVLGIKREALARRMQADGWVYRQNGAWTPYHDKIRAGMLVLKEARYTHESGAEATSIYCHITQKGIARLARDMGMDEPTPPTRH